MIRGYIVVAYKVTRSGHILQDAMLKINYKCSYYVRRGYATGHDVRSRFIEYFKGHDHKYVKSSSVVPLCDPTISFVNSGMNQFKPIFLGTCSAPYPRVVNSQKCIRVGGKHNDLEVVGKDGHHHTFFEMLGNWSFSDYSKMEACQMAWTLLTGPYKLKPEQLHVTYFGGDSSLNLTEDKECHEIWRKIGVPDSAITPMGIADNFWEMGPTGPCGPCTEIHFRNEDGSLTELWNIVFIQYNRELDGSVTRLPKQYIDTGMGLERMTALLQNKKSNYDTDLFLPIINAIEKKNKYKVQYMSKFGDGCEVDCAYRCLADHARMISVCLADGMYPGCNLSLKQIMKKSFSISENVFDCQEGMLTELYDHVTEILGDTFPELHSKMNESKKIIRHEEESFVQLRKKMKKTWKDFLKHHPEAEHFESLELPGFVEGYKQFKAAMKDMKSSIIPGNIAFKLTDSHGIGEDIILEIAKINGYSVDLDSYKLHLSKHKAKHKIAIIEKSNTDRSYKFDVAINRIINSGIDRTLDEYKYHYSINDANVCVFDDLSAKIVSILNSEGENVEEVETSSGSDLYLILDKSNFYCEDGGQTYDNGQIIINENVFDVTSVFKVRDFVFHKGKFRPRAVAPCKISAGSEVQLAVNGNRRLKIMRNHTATHLLNSVVKNVLGNNVARQIGSAVNENGMSLDLAIYGEKLSKNVILEVQNKIRNLCKQNIPVSTSVVNSVELSKIDDVITIPGEVYPENDLRLLKIENDNFHSRELCCGTHVPSTRFIEEFCITIVRGAGSHTPTIRGVTGDAAREIHKISKTIKSLKKNFETRDQIRLEDNLISIREKLKQLCPGEGAPHGEYAVCLEEMDKLENMMKDLALVSLNKLAEKEIREVASQPQNLQRPYIIHFLVSSYLMESASLEQAMQGCKDKPVMILGCANGVIKAACQVPKNCLTKEFTASKWLSCILPVFNTKLAKTNKRDERTFASMNGKKVSLTNCEQLVQDAMKLAISYAKKHNTTEENRIQDQNVCDMSHS